MTLAELLVKIGSAILSIIAILVVIYFIDKAARKKAEQASKEFNEFIKSQKKNKNKK